MPKRWFISYSFDCRDMLGNIISSGKGNIVTDVSPAKWLVESQMALGGERWINYAEEISFGLAAELTIGGAGIATAYFNEDV